MIRVVIDTNVLVAALRSSTGASHKILLALDQGDFEVVNQFVSLAVAEKLSALQTFNLITEKAAKGSRKSFLKAMSMVPAGDVVPGDEIPAAYKGKTKRPS